VNDQNIGHLYVMLSLLLVHLKLSVLSYFCLTEVLQFAT